MSDDSMSPKALRVPFDINQLTDGCFYHLVKTTEFEQQNLFSRVSFQGDSVIKVPTDGGFEQYRKYVRDELPDPDSIRDNEPEEKFANAIQLVERFPEFTNSWQTFDKNKVHFLLVYKLQYQRLKSSGLISVPESRFVFLSGGGLSDVLPAIVQSKVPGITIQEALANGASGMTMPDVAQKLETLLASPLRNHLDWNIRNFLIDSTSSNLCYVDPKPSTVFSRRINDQNICGLRHFFGTGNTKRAPAGCFLIVVVFFAAIAWIAYQRGESPTTIAVSLVLAAIVFFAIMAQPMVGVSNNESDSVVK